MVSVVAKPGSLVVQFICNGFGTNGVDLQVGCALWEVKFFISRKPCLKPNSVLRRARVRYRKAAKSRNTALLTC